MTFAVQYNKDLVEIEVPVGYEGLKADYLSVDPSYTSVHWVSKMVRQFLQMEVFLEQNLTFMKKNYLLPLQQEMMIMK